MTRLKLLINVSSEGLLRVSYLVYRYPHTAKIIPDELLPYDLFNNEHFISVNIYTDIYNRKISLQLGNLQLAT